ncbi:hypothetical protein [Succinimonas amylolytica]|uniref:hypothetical protein n=1 Tax=Succinimonas amylolytica TaxID=83769 RepID=UPI0023A8D86E
MSERIAYKIEELQKYREFTLSKNEAVNLYRHLTAFPEGAVIAGIDYYITGRDYFTLNNLLVTIRDIMEQDPNYSPAKQWALVRKQLQSDDFCSLKVLFDNVKTNLAIELIGGQGYLLDTYTEDREPFLRKEFIENFHKAVIRPGLNWRDWIVYNPVRYTSFRQNTVNLTGYSINKEISETEADRLFVNAVNNGQPLLINQKVFAIQG